MNAKQTLYQLRTIREIKERRIVTQIMEVHQRIKDIQKRIQLADDQLRIAEKDVEDYAKKQFFELNTQNNKEIGFFSISVGVYERRRKVVRLKLRMTRDQDLLNETKGRKAILAKDLEKITQTNEAIFKYIDNVGSELAELEEDGVEEEILNIASGAVHA